MTPYANSNGTSGVAAFEIHREAIVVEFRHGGKYLYDHHTTGRVHVEEMKVLALEGRGLATYINKHVRNRFAEKLGGPSYRIRPAVPGDIAELESMLELYLPETYHAAFLGDVERLGVHLESGLVRIAVAEKNKALAGLLGYVDTYDLHWCIPGSEVIDFYVQPGHRGLGAAVHLVAWVANEVSERGASFLKSGPIEYPPVRRLYQKVALFQSSGEAYVSGRALRHLASLSGKGIREIVKNLPRPEWSREP